MFEENYEVNQRLPNHHFRTEIPNILFDLGMDPEYLAVYCHLKRIAGDSSSCWLSLKNLCQRTGLKETRLKLALKQLSSTGVFFEFPLIVITERYKTDGSRNSNSITITDIWKENGDWYRSDEYLRKTKLKQYIKGGVGQPAPGGGSRADGGAGQPAPSNQEPYEEEPIKKNHQPNLPPKVKPDKPKRKLVDGGFLNEIKKEFGQATVELAYDEFMIALNKEKKISDPQAYFRKICERLHYAIDDMPKQKCTPQEEKNNYLLAKMYEHQFNKKGGCINYSVTHLTHYIEFQGPQEKIENIPYKLPEAEFITRCNPWVSKLKIQVDYN